MDVINVGDIVRRIEFQGSAEAFVTVIEKKDAFVDGWILNEYTVLQPDGTIATYTDAVLRKIK